MVSVSDFPNRGSCERLCSPHPPTRHPAEPAVPGHPPAQSRENSLQPGATPGERGGSIRGRSSIQRESSMQKMSANAKAAPGNAKFEGAASARSPSVKGGASVGPAVAFSGVSWMENLIEAQSLPDWEADGRDQDLEHKDVVFLRHAKNDLRSFWIIKTMQNLLYCTSLAIHGAVRHRDIDLGASTPEWEACSPGFDRLRDGKTADQSQNDTDRGVPPT
eukprot:g32427.t1